MVKLLSHPDQTATILGAAVEVLRTKGPGGLTVRNVAAAAGCSTTGVYTWFGGKTGLVDAILMEGFESFDAALAQVPLQSAASAAIANNPRINWLVARGLEYRRWALGHATEYLVMFTKAVPEHRPSEGALRRSAESFEAHVESVRLVQAAGDLLGVNAEFIARHIWATVHGHVMLELTEPGCQATDPDWYEEGLRATLRGFQAA